MEEREGSFDLTGYEVADFKLFSDQSVPAIMLHKDSIAFSVAGIREMDLKDNYVELLVHPLRKEIAVRPTDKDNRCAIQWANGVRGNRSFAFGSSQGLYPDPLSDLRLGAGQQL